MTQILAEWYQSLQKMGGGILWVVLILTVGVIAVAVLRIISSGKTKPPAGKSPEGPGSGAGAPGGSPK